MRKGGKCSNTAFPLIWKLKQSVKLKFIKGFKTLEFLLLWLMFKVLIQKGRLSKKIKFLKCLNVKKVFVKTKHFSFSKSLSAFSTKQINTYADKTNKVENQKVYNKLVGSDFRSV